MAETNGPWLDTRVRATPAPGPAPASRSDALRGALLEEGGIIIARERVPREELARLAEAHFGDMVKFVADVALDVIAAGGELHSDAEAVLLERGSRQDDLWGGNYYPGRGRDRCIEYTSLVNIRPARGNPMMQVTDPDVRARIREIVFRTLGKGEPLA